MRQTRIDSAPTEATVAEIKLHCAQAQVKLYENAINLLDENKVIDNSLRVIGRSWSIFTGRKRVIHRSWSILSMSWSDNLRSPGPRILLGVAHAVSSGVAPSTTTGALPDARHHVAASAIYGTFTDGIFEVMHDELVLAQMERALQEPPR